MAFSGQTVTRPARGSEARKIAGALRKGVGITGPAHEELMKRLRALRTKQTSVAHKQMHGAPAKKSV